MEVAGVTFAGICAIPDLRNWAFYADAAQRQHIFAQLPAVDVLINHAPLLSYASPYFTYKGCSHAQAYVDKHSDRLQAYICGHIHEAHGQTILANGVAHANVAILDENYEGCRAPTVITIN